MKDVIERMRQLAIELRMHAQTPELLNGPKRTEAFHNVATYLDQAVQQIAAPVPMILSCPACRERHIDRGEFATKPHHTHACQGCGMVWRPALVPTVGVQFLPGFKDAAPADQAREVTRCGAWSYPGHESWDCKLGKPDGRQCALDRNHHGNHELVGPWTSGAYPGEKR